MAIHLLNSSLFVKRNEYPTNINSLAAKNYINTNYLLYQMKVLILVYMTVIFFVIIGIIGTAMILSPARVSSSTPECWDSPDDNLSIILNKTGSYKFAYVFAYDKRIAVIDETGSKYFYIYDVFGRPELIINQDNRAIWQNNCP